MNTKNFERKIKPRVEYIHLFHIQSSHSYTNTTKETERYCSVTIKINGKQKEKRSEYISLFVYNLMTAFVLKKNLESSSMISEIKLITTAKLNIYS